MRIQTMSNVLLGGERFTNWSGRMGEQGSWGLLIVLLFTFISGGGYYYYQSRGARRQLLCPVGDN